MARGSTRKKSPFVEKDTLCAACETQAPQRFFRQHLFVAAQTDSDQHILEYQWLSNDVEQVPVQYYQLYSCPNCCFTDFARDYLNPEANPFSTALVRCFQAMDSRKQALLDLVAGHCWTDNLDHGSAMNLYFMALLIQLLPERSEQNAYKIGRLLLRIAWLYREHHAEGPLSLNGGPFFAYSSYDAFFEELRQHWGEVPASESEAMQSAVLYFQLALEADSRFDDDEKYMTLAELIMDILVRCENVEAAFKMVSHISLAGSAARARLRTRLKQGRMDEETYRRMEKSMNRVNDVMEHAGDTHHELVAIQAERELPRIQTIVAAHGDQPWPVIEKALKGENIAPAIISHLTAEGRPLATRAAKKKGWFS